MMEQLPLSNLDFEGLTWGEGVAEIDTFYPPTPPGLVVAPANGKTFETDDGVESGALPERADLDANDFHSTADLTAMESNALPHANAAHAFVPLPLPQPPFDAGAQLTSAIRLAHKNWPPMPLGNPLEDIWAANATSTQNQVLGLPGSRNIQNHEETRCEDHQTRPSVFVPEQMQFAMPQTTNMTALKRARPMSSPSSAQMPPQKISKTLSYQSGSNDASLLVHGPIDSVLSSPVSAATQLSVQTQSLPQRASQSQFTAFQADLDLFTQQQFGLQAQHYDQTPQQPQLHYGKQLQARLSAGYGYDAQYEHAAQYGHVPQYANAAQYWNAAQRPMDGLPWPNQSASDDRHVADHYQQAQDGHIFGLYDAQPNIVSHQGSAAIVMEEDKDSFLTSTSYHDDLNLPATKSRNNQRQTSKASADITPKKIGAAIRQLRSRSTAVDAASALTPKKRTLQSGAETVDTPSSSTPKPGTQHKATPSRKKSTKFERSNFGPAVPENLCPPPSTPPMANHYDDVQRASATTPTRKPMKAPSLAMPPGPTMKNPAKPSAMTPVGTPTGTPAKSSSKKKAKIPFERSNFGPISPDAEPAPPPGPPRQPAMRKNSNSGAEKRKSSNGTQRRPSSKGLVGRNELKATIENAVMGSLGTNPRRLTRGDKQKAKEAQPAFSTSGAAKRRHNSKKVVK